MQCPLSCGNCITQYWVDNSEEISGPILDLWCFVIKQVIFLIMMKLAFWNHYLWKAKYYEVNYVHIIPIIMFFIWERPDRKTQYSFCNCWWLELWPCKCIRMHMDKNSGIRSTCPRRNSVQPSVHTQRKMCTIPGHYTDWKKFLAIRGGGQPSEYLPR